MEFRTFVNLLVRLPAQIVCTCRRLVVRLLGWNEWQPVLLRLAANCADRCAVETHPPGVVRPTLGRVLRNGILVDPVRRVPKPERISPHPADNKPVSHHCHHSSRTLSVRGSSPDNRRIFGIRVRLFQGWRRPCGLTPGGRRQAGEHGGAGTTHRRAVAAGQVERVARRGDWTRFSDDLEHTAADTTVGSTPRSMWYHAERHHEV